MHLSDLKKLSCASSVPPAKDYEIRNKIINKGIGDDRATQAYAIFAIFC